MISFLTGWYLSHQASNKCSAYRLNHAEAPPLPVLFKPLMFQSPDVGYIGRELMRFLPRITHVFNLLFSNGAIRALATNYE